MVRFDLSTRYDPDELAQRIAYYESLSKERQLDFIISDYYSARVDNEYFDRRKVHGYASQQKIKGITFKNCADCTISSTVCMMQSY